ncbi:hypothetical protein [Candidatus Leptofilum sp.]
MARLLCQCEDGRLPEATAVFPINPTIDKRSGAVGIPTTAVPF